jgi:hypothetical protein
MLAADSQATQNSVMGVRYAVLFHPPLKWNWIRAMVKDSFSSTERSGRTFQPQSFQAHSALFRCAIPYARQVPSLGTSSSDCGMQVIQPVFRYHG